MLPCGAFHLGLQLTFAKVFINESTNQYLGQPAEGFLHCNYPLVALDTYSKTCVKQPLSKRPKIGFQGQLSLNNAGQKYCRSLSYHLSLRSLLCLFLSGRFTTVLLFDKMIKLYSKMVHI